MATIIAIKENIAQNPPGRNIKFLCHCENDFKQRKRRRKQKRLINKWEFVKIDLQSMTWIDIVCDDAKLV